MRGDRLAQSSESAANIHIASSPLANAASIHLNVIGASPTLATVVTARTNSTAAPKSPTNRPRSLPVAPTFHTCIVCDLVRQELAGKLIILGYYGVCPTVDVSVSDLGQPTLLTFLVSGDAGEGKFSGMVGIFDESDQRLLASVSLAITAQPNVMTVLAPTIVVVFGRPGAYSLRVLLDDTERFRGEFRISQGIQA